MKARTRVAAAILIFAALPLILASFANLRQRQADAAATGDLVLAGNASEAAALIESTRTRWLESVRADALLPGVDAMLLRDPSLDPLHVSRFFEAVGSRDTVNISAIGLLDLEGRVVEDSRVVNGERDESLAPWFLRALASGQPQIVGPLLPEGESAPGLYLTSLVRDATGTRRGVLRVRLQPAVLGQVLGMAMVASPTLSASLLDEEHRVIAGIGPIGEAPLALPMTAANPGDAPLSIDVAGERVAVVVVANAPWRIAVRQPRDEWLAAQRELRDEWLLQTLLMLALLFAASLLLGRRIAAPLARFRDVAERMAEGDYRPVPAWPGAQEARELSVALDGLAARLRDTIGSLSRELEQRREAEAALRSSRGAFLALVEQLPGAVYRCANRPGWPMAYLSPQIEQITGYPAETLMAGDGLGFTALLSPEDAAANVVATEAAMHGSGRYDLRYRIRHRDGSLRWVWELGSVHPDAEGAPDTLTGVMFDVTERETTQQAMALLRGRLDAQVGGSYFAALATGLARLLDADAVLIGRFDGEPPDTLRTLAFADRSGRNERVEFPIEGTPSEMLLALGRLEYGDGVQAQFPDDANLAARGTRAYIGRRLDASDGRPLGVLAVLDSEPMQADATAVLMLDLVQARAAAELERMLAGEALQCLAETLENRVSERTAELEAVNASLSRAMDQLVQREKLASLGSLVAGVAHELNTPIGNALTVATALREIHQRLGDDLAGGQLKRSMLEQFVSDNDEATKLIERNLERAATLISHFKEVAVDQSSMRRRRFDLREVVVDVLSTMSPRMKRLPHQVEVDIPPGLFLESYPGPLEQVLTNLIENSLVHAFDAGEAGCIRISATAVGERIRLNYEDNGRGIPGEVRHRVFDPFFTTRMGQGGSGLGLYLVYTLVHGRLGGTIRLTDCDGRGTCFVVDLPATAPADMEERCE